MAPTHPSALSSGRSRICKGGSTSHILKLRPVFIIVCMHANDDLQDVETCSHLNKKTIFQVVPPLNRKMAHTFQMCMFPERVRNSEKCVGNIPATIQIFLQNENVLEGMECIVE